MADHSIHESDQTSNQEASKQSSRSRGLLGAVDVENGGRRRPVREGELRGSDGRREKEESELVCFCFYISWSSRIQKLY